MIILLIGVDSMKAPFALPLLMMATFPRCFLSFSRYTTFSPLWGVTDSVPLHLVSLLPRGYYGAYQPLGFWVAAAPPVSVVSLSTLLVSPCCLTNGFCLVQLLFLLPSSPTQVCFPTVLFQVVFGLPLVLRPLGANPNAVKQSFSPSLLSM